MSLTILDKLVCNKINSTYHKITGQIMYAANTDISENQSSCHGDSGGPFVCRNTTNGSWILQGAVSWGSPRCDVKDAFTVFAKFGQLRDWIDKNML